MKSQVLSQFTHIWLPSFALIIFLSVFIVMLIYVWKKSAVDGFKDIENLPFDEGRKDER
jgi:hypothetical protein